MNNQLKALGLKEGISIFEETTHFFVNNEQITTEAARNIIFGYDIIGIKVYNQNRLSVMDTVVNFGDTKIKMADEKSPDAIVDYILEDYRQCKKIKKSKDMKISVDGMSNGFNFIIIF